MVLLYLAGSPATLLENVLVEKEQVASAVYYSTEDRPRTEIHFTLTSVEAEKLADVERRFFEVLHDAMVKDLDMQYLHECIQRHRRSWKFATETSASSFAEYVISDFLFGKRNGDTLLHVASLREYDELETWHDNQWRGFIKQWISEAPHVSILGVPSSKIAAKLKADEENRVNKRKNELGDEGLKHLADKLEKAKSENDKDIPRDELAHFKVPGTESIHFVETKTARSGSALKAGRPQNKLQDRIDTDGTDLPLFIHFEHIQSNFVQVFLNVSTQSVPVELRPLLSVYTEAFFNLPVVRNGQNISFEQVIVELERDTVGYSMEVGYNNPEILSVTFQVELEKYEAVISWLKELTWNSIFDIERLRAINARLLADVPDAKRSGSSMLQAVQAMVQYTPESILRARTSLVKAQYLKYIKQKLAKEPETVVARMEELRQCLCRFENFRVFIIADMERLPNPVSAWKPFVDGLKVTEELKQIVRPRERLSDAAKEPGSIGYIVPMPTIDSSFASATAKGPDSYDDPKLPALLVAMAYMNAVEGPLWVAVRGTGLAYGTSFRHNVDAGLVHFGVYRSPNAHKAFVASRKIVEDHLSGATQFDPLMTLEGAISSIVVNFVNEQATEANAAIESFIRQVIRGLPEDYKEQILKKVRAIGIDEIKEALRETIMPLFTPGKSNVLVTCAPVLEEVCLQFHILSDNL